MIPDLGPRPFRRTLGLLSCAAFAATAWTAAQLSPSGVGVGFGCLPSDQLREPRRCLDLGPGGELERQARAGETDHPLPTLRPDPDLGFIPFDYIRIKEGGAGVYPSPQDAASGSGSTSQLPNGFVFLSYGSVSDVDGGSVYATGGGYVRGERATKITPLSFHGLQFSRTPDRAFGWIRSGTLGQREPGGAEDWTATWYPLRTLVSILDVRRVGDLDWYEVAPQEWVVQTAIAIVTPDTTRPPGVEGDRWIRINLYEQTVEAYRGGELIFATLASTGRYGYWTQPGAFQVWAKLERDTMSGGVSEPEGGNYYYLEDVPWVLYFDQSRALHGTYWHARFGTSTSHGCVNLAPSDAHWIYEFAEEGTWVYVWDPSGQTPTDPALYGAGGA
ncbi:MAG: L,D-transpeptidase [Anaerolineales bacterium]